MCKMVRMMALLILSLALALAQPACAEPGEAVRGICGALCRDDSGYSQLKAAYAEYYPDVAYEEALNDDGFTVAVRPNVDADAVGESIRDANEEYSDAVIRMSERPAPAKAPTAEELREGYFDVLASVQEGTAGATLKQAVAASEVCAFAEAHALYDPDAETLRANMHEAFEAMDADRQAAFWEGFDIVRALLDDCLEDYDAQREVFEDAGVAEVMDEMMYDPLNRLAWENLRDHTQGNREGQ